MNELVSKIVDETIDEINETGEYATLQKNDDELLFGTESALDSMGLVNLITIIEQKIEDQTGEYISIADENAMSLEQSPFRTVGVLKNYVSGLMPK